MAFITATDTRAHSGFLAGLSDYAAAQRAAFGQWRQYRRTVNELSALSGAELADLGLSRASIHSAAYEAVYNK
ncbi:DUF1127 domain-containing protein [Roseobacter sp. HKCCA0434]|uniref:DUF1127 domain-containing protein n=1 Tax=Roseobacter sp. HKCCA0434 TaxID=3079297 RepID=UPI002905D4D6|nr:DUF1127 domain-containing protein [Roseobacter sp. HKCCA0434]